MRIIKTGFIFLLVMNLVGCAAAVVAGATTTGVIVNDQRSFGSIRDDHNLRHHIHTLYVRDERFSGSSIVVSSFNHHILLAGTTLTEELKVEAEKIARSTPEVQRVYNEVTVSSPVSGMITTSDAWITTKIRTAMLAQRGLKSGTVKVVTDNGTVYLMGEVTHSQADLAVDVARRISGVQRVVKVFQYQDQVEVTEVA